MKCDECGTMLPCVEWIGLSHEEKFCKECDEQFVHCYTKCKNPCRNKDDQEKMFDKVKPEWREYLIK